MPTNRAFYALFWLTPVAPAPAIDGELVSPGGFELPPDASDLRAQLCERLRYPPGATDVLETIVVCDRYAALLAARRELLEPGCASTRWRSAFSSEAAKLPLEMGLPMVLATRALLSLRLVRQTLKDRSPAAINRAVLSLQRAAGSLEHAATLVDRPSSPGDAALPELSREVLRALSGFCCALAQQLAIVRAVLHFDKPYSKMVLLTLHTGCEAAYRELELALQRQVGPLASFAAFFSQLHGAQAYELAAEIEYMNTGIGEGIAYTLPAEQCFHERAGSSASPLGLPPLSTVSASVTDDGVGGGDKFESIARILLTAKCERLAVRARDWKRENDSACFALVPPASELLASPLPRVFLIKPRVVSGDRVSEHESDADEVHDEDDDHDDDYDYDCTVEESASSNATSDERSFSEGFEPRVGPTEIDLDLALEPSWPRSTDERSSVLLRRSTEPGESALVAGELRASGIRVAPLPVIDTHTVMPEGRTSFVASTASRRGSVAEREALAAARVRRELLDGKRVWRLTKHRKWIKETLTLLDSGLLFKRKKHLSLFRSQARVHWVSVLGMQLEAQGHGNSRIQSTHERNSTSILLVTGAAAPLGESKTFEFTTNEVLENAALLAVLEQEMQAFRQQKGAGGGRRKSILLRQNTVSY